MRSYLSKTRTKNPHQFKQRSLKSTNTRQPFRNQNRSFADQNLFTSRACLYRLRARSTLTIFWSSKPFTFAPSSAHLSSTGTKLIPGSPRGLILEKRLLLALLEYLVFKTAFDMRLWVLLKIAKNRIGAIWRLSSAIMVSDEVLVQAWPAERCLGISQLGLGFQGGFKG